jgi:D-alanine-D-alanine ligase
MRKSLRPNKVETMKKLKVAVLFGGKSGEHEVSLLSAASVLNAIDKTKYDVTMIGIGKDGRWLLGADAKALLAGERGASKLLGTGTALAQNPASAMKVDVVFPVLHGTFGEDGTIQGLFELADIAYVGSGVLGSAAGMDKDTAKRLFAAAGLPIPKHVTLLRSEWKSSAKKCTALIEKSLKYPVFVKPANLGSSVGISKVHDRTELAAAMDHAAGFDRKLVIEEGVGGKRGQARELEVAVLGNDAPEASVVGEIVPGKEFYDYEDKYLSAGSVPIIPAELTKAESKRIREMALAAFKACDCAGLARVDFLMEPSYRKKDGAVKPGRIYLNEINTLPGFTAISMYPKLWAASGLPYAKLIDKLIALAQERHAEKQQTHFSKD